MLFHNVQGDIGIFRHQFIIPSVLRMALYNLPSDIRIDRYVIEIPINDITVVYNGIPSDVLIFAEHRNASGRNISIRKFVDFVDEIIRPKIECDIHLLMILSI